MIPTCPEYGAVTYRRVALLSLEFEGVSDVAGGVGALRLSLRQGRPRSGCTGGIGGPDGEACPGTPVTLRRRGQYAGCSGRVVPVSSRWC